MRRGAHHRAGGGLELCRLGRVMSGTCTRTCDYRTGGGAEIKIKEGCGVVFWRCWDRQGRG